MNRTDDKGLTDFLNGKSPHTLELFNHLEKMFNEIGAITVGTTKSMITFGATKKFAYVIQLGKNFIDVVFPFKQEYPDNLCFNKIKAVPGSDDYNHHLRVYFKEDLNDEVKMYMKLAYDNAS